MVKVFLVANYCDECDSKPAAAFSSGAEAGKYAGVSGDSVVEIDVDLPWETITHVTVEVKEGGEAEILQERQGIKPETPPGSSQWWKDCTPTVPVRTCFWNDEEMERIAGSKTYTVYGRDDSKEEYRLVYRGTGSREKVMIEALEAAAGAKREGRWPKKSVKT